MCMEQYSVKNSFYLSFCFHNTTVSLAYSSLCCCFHLLTLHPTARLPKVAECEADESPPRQTNWREQNPEPSKCPPFWVSRCWQLAVIFLAVKLILSVYFQVKRWNSRPPNQLTNRFLFTDVSFKAFIIQLVQLFKIHTLANPLFIHFVKSNAVFTNDEMTNELCQFLQKFLEVPR